MQQLLQQLGCQSLVDSAEKLVQLMLEHVGEYSTPHSCGHAHPTAGAKRIWILTSKAEVVDFNSIQLTQKECMQGGEVLITPCL